MLVRIRVKFGFCFRFMGLFRVWVPISVPVRFRVMVSFSFNLEFKGTGRVHVGAQVWFRFRVHFGAQVWFRLRLLLRLHLGRPKSLRRLLCCHSWERSRRHGAGTSQFCCCEVKMRMLAIFSNPMPLSNPAPFRGADEPPSPTRTGKMIEYRIWITNEPCCIGTKVPHSWGKS